MTSCDMKTAAALINAFSGLLQPGQDPSPDPSDHECVFEADGDDRVRLVKCSVEGCEKYGRPDDDGTYPELFEEYKNFEEKKDEIFAFCDEFSDYLSKLEKYDPEKHAFSEGSKTEKDSAEAVEMAEQLDDYYYYVSDVYSIVNLYYYSDVEEYGDLYKAAEDFSDDFEKKYYEIEIACYECAYREYLFPESEGWTEEALKEEIEHAEVHSKDELIELVDAVQDVSFRIDQISDAYFSDDICELTAELIEANNALAKHLGYENYYVYAMENEYGRDYTVENIEDFTAFVKKYIPDIMWDYYDKYGYSYGSSDFMDSVVYGSFFTDPAACEAVWSFLKSIEAEQEKGAESYYKSANDPLTKGNLKYSDSDNVYETAYTDYLYGEEIPVLFFSEPYSDVQTFVHEHGHYHAALTDSADQVSYDFNETQSQGAELMYTAFLKDYFEECGEDGYVDVAIELITNDILTVVYSLADDEFERAVYSNNYEGIEDPEGKLSDGVTPDEYDYLYHCIMLGYDVDTSNYYWRNTVSKSPCYYVSYAVSMITSLEIFAEAVNNGYEAGAAAYLALFDAPCSDGYEDRECSDIEYYCEYAGIESPFEEAAYQGIVSALNSIID